MAKEENKRKRSENKASTQRIMALIGIEEIVAYHRSNIEAIGNIGGMAAASAA